MRILLELPAWLGDAVMSTAAIENIVKLNYVDSITIVGSFVSIEAIKNFPKVDRVFVDDTKTKNNRLFSIYRLAKSIGKHDIAISFRSHFSSRLLLFFTDTKRRYLFDKKRFFGHQAERYNAFVNSVFNMNLDTGNLKLCYKPKIFSNPTIGINPGAAYGNAKRWYPERFAQVANELAKYGDIIIFGGKNEIDIANDIEKRLTIQNYKNIAGKTTVSEIVEYIAGLTLFITNDSGPMHIAAAYKVPTISIFGPTNPKETSQWKNENGIIIRKKLTCSPCMKRQCPIKTHDCMKLITAEEVIEKALTFLSVKQ